MGSFYGNIKNDQRISLIFDRIYPSRVAMETALTEVKDENNAIKGDGIFINRYVLVNYAYSYKDANSKQLVYTGEYFKDFNDDSENIENQQFKANLQADINKYHKDYHLTIWMKIYSDEEEKYILVGHLKATAPSLNIIPDAPGGEPHFDFFQSSDTQYTYHVPKNWDIVLYDSPYVNIGEYVNGEGETIKNDAIYQNYDLSENSISFEEQAKDENSLYPDHIYKEVILTQNAYIPRQYYYLTNDEQYVLATDTAFDTNKKYFIKTSINSSGFIYKKIENISNDNYEVGKYYYKDNDEYKLAEDDFVEDREYYEQIESPILFSKQNDQKALKIHLPALGNAMAEMYDALYGKEVDENQKRKYLSNFLFKYDGIMPYNNLTPDDNISMAWAIDELKSYISELRFLSHGQGWRLLGYTTEEIAQNYLNTGDGIKCIVNKDNKILTNEQINQLKPYDYQTGYIIPVYTADQDDNNAIGLQSDWILADPKAFGYIYHKPRMLWSDPNYNNNSNIISKNPYYETLQSIEYIYNSIKLKENEIINKDNLFGKYDNSRDPILLGYTSSGKLQNYFTEQNNNKDLFECIIINSTTPIIKWLSNEHIQDLKQNFGDSIDSNIYNIPVYKKI